LSPHPRGEDVESHPLLKRLQIELHGIGKSAFEHEIRHHAGELPDLNGVSAEPDRDFAAAAVDGDALVAIASISAS
jgi:hypothetical protein